MAMVEIRNLVKRYGDFTAVDKISFQVDKGEVLGFLGPNGAGKSTTMKMVTGFLAPDDGSVAIGGHDIAADPVAAKKLIGYLPEGAPAYPDMTPAGFLEFIAEIRGLTGMSRTQRITETIAKVHLDKVLYQPIDTLSKGFKRRVGLAQAILHDPAVLVLDEPTDGLDPNQKHEVRALIHNMAAEKVIILSTHILEEVEAVCTRAIIIAGGKLIADKTPTDLEAQSPLHNSITVTFRGPAAAQARKALEQVDEIKSVESMPAEDGQVSFRILPKNNQAPVAAISQLAQQHHWEVDELHVHRGRLDDVFRSLTAAHQART